MTFWRRPAHPVRDSELSAHLDGALDARARARVEAHVEGCAACRETLDGLRAVRQALRELPPVAAPRSFALREADVRAQPRSAPARGWAAPMLSGVSVAALVAFGTLVSVDLVGSGSGSGSSGSRPGFDASGGAPEAISQFEDGDQNTLAAPEKGATEADGAIPELAPVEATGLPSATPPMGALQKDMTDRAPSYAAPAATTATPPPPTAAAEAFDDARGDDGGGNDVALRAAEATTAAVAVGSAGSLAFVWRRRRR